MIQVTVELISAVTGRKTLLGVAMIANTGEGTKTRGNYTAVFALKKKVNWRSATVENYPRQAKNAWYLLRDLLTNALGAK